MLGAKSYGQICTEVKLQHWKQLPIWVLKLINRSSEFYYTFDITNILWIISICFDN